MSAESVPAARLTPDPPSGLAERGTALWCAVTETWALRDDELELLREVVRTVDVVETLAAIVADEGPIIAGKMGPRTHPAAVEVRLQRLALGKLLGQLQLPDEHGSVMASPASARGRKAAETRWSGHVKRGR